MERKMLIMDNTDFYRKLCAHFSNLKIGDISYSLDIFSYPMDYTFRYSPLNRYSTEFKLSFSSYSHGDLEKVRDILNKIIELKHEQEKAKETGTDGAEESKV
jgi:hypothetical protein